MPYKIHLENKKPVHGSHIIPELPPLFTVETREDAEAELKRLVARGVTNVYAVGFDA